MAEQITPFDLVFGRTGMAEKHFPLIRAAAGGAPLDRDRFLALPPVGELLAEITPPGGEGGAQIGLLAFHSYRCWEQGGQDLAVEAAGLRELLLGPDLGPWQLETPAPAGYLRLPRHLLWVPGAAGEPAEPVDGVFWVAGDPAVNALDLLLVLGMHEGRGGLTAIELISGPLPASGHWGDLRVREQGSDFGNLLPGGEHLLGLSTPGEALKLVSRVFWGQRSHG